VRDVYLRTAVSPDRAHLLFALVRTIAPRRGLEMGSGIGISALYLAAALELNGDGHLLTMEGAEDRAELAGRHVERLGLRRRVTVRVGTFARTLDAVLAEGPVDLAFVDGHHKEEPTVDYFERIVAGADGEVVLVFDDIAWSWGMRRAWRRIVADARVVVSADLGHVGIAVARVRP
jgi:predicted O-methyltransferase YrrM